MPERRRIWSAGGLAGAALALALALGAGAARAATITYELIPLGGSDYQIVYTVENDGSLGAGVAILLFDVLFDPGLYAESSIAVATPAPLASAWSEIVLASAPGVPAAYDALALAGGIAAGTSASGFTLTFRWLGLGTPGSQPFEIYDSVSFALLEQGMTANVAPLPPPIALLATACAALVAARARRGRRRVSRALRVLGGWAAVGGLLAASETASAAVIGPPGIEIDGYELVSSVRLTRTQFEYTYRADVSNWFQDASISATLSSGAANITVLDGGLTFDEVVEGDTVQSTDTFKIRVDRSAPFDERLLDWTVTLTPLPPTTFELIDAALAAGQIDYETSLTYKVYDSFGDSRLPSAFQGREDGFIDNPVTEELRANFSSLSPPTQTLLAPFLMFAAEPGSWQELQLAAQGLSLPSTQVQALAGGRTKKKSKRARRMSPLATAAPAATAPQPVDTANGKVRVWWLPERPQDQARAIAFAAEIDNYLWRKLTSAFREPLPDLIELLPTGSPIYFLGDPRLDVVLTTASRAQTVTTLHSCNGTAAGASIELGPRDGVETLAHELMHAIQFAYPSAGCLKSSERTWMAEATANWAEQFAYPSSNFEHGGWIRNREYFGAVHFMMSPEVELNFANGKREYGAYLWFLHMAGQGNNAGPVRAVWEGVATQTSRDAIESVLQSSGLGGFAKQWPQFALRDWNRLAGIEKPHREFFQWDRLRKKAAEASKGPKRLAPPSNFVTRWPLEHTLPPLSTTYHHFDFKVDQKTHTLFIENGYARTDPRAGVWAIVKIKGGDWVKAEDWTNRDKIVYCRDKAAENVEELVIVITNRDHTGAPGAADLGGIATRTTSPVTLQLSPLPCNDWQGTAEFFVEEFSQNASEVTRSTTRDLKFAFDPSRSTPAFNYYRVAVGAVVDWEITTSGNGCALHAAADSFAPEGDLIIGTGGTSLIYFLHGQGPGSSKTVTAACSGGPTDLVYEFSDWLPTSTPAFSLPNGATTIIDRLEFSPTYPAIYGWSWSFTKLP
jgi:hypothetical protein